MESENTKTRREESLPELRSLLCDAGTAGYAAYRLSLRLSTQKLTICDLQQQGLLEPLVAMLDGDPTSEGAYYALRSLYASHNHNQEKWKTLALAQASAGAAGLLTVLRSGAAPHVPACQQLSASLLWSISAKGALDEALAGCEGAVDTLVSALQPRFDTCVQVAASGVLASLVPQADIRSQLWEVSELLQSLTGLLRRSVQSSAAGALPPANAEDSVYMRIHGMKIISGLLMCPEGAEISDAEDVAIVIGRLLPWLMAEDVTETQGSVHSFTLRQELVSSHGVCTEAVMLTLAAHEDARQLASEHFEGGATGLTKRLVAQYAGSLNAGEASRTDAAVRAKAGILKLLARLTSDSSECRSVVEGGEVDLVEQLSKVLAYAAKHGATSLSSSELRYVAYAVAALAQLVQHPGMLKRFTSTSSSRSASSNSTGSLTKKPGRKHSPIKVLWMIAQQLSAGQATPTASSSSSAAAAAAEGCGEMAEEMLGMLDSVLANDLSFSGRDLFRLAEMACFVTTSKDLPQSQHIATLARVITGLLSRLGDRQREEEAGEAWAPLIQSAALVLQLQDHRTCVLLAHCLRRTARVAGSEVAARIACAPSLTDSLIKLVEPGLDAITGQDTGTVKGDSFSSLQEAMANDRGATADAAEMSEVCALLVEGLALTSQTAAQELAGKQDLVVMFSRLMTLQASPRSSQDLLHAAAGASAAAAGALAAMSSAASDSCRVDVLPRDFITVTRLLHLMTSLPAALQGARPGRGGGGARGGAEHIAALLAATAIHQEDGDQLVANAILDYVGALEVLMAMLPQPPVTSGPVVQDAEWKDGAVPAEAAFGIGSLSVLRLLNVLVQAPELAQVIADEVEVMPPLLWCCLARPDESHRKLSGKASSSCDSSASSCLYSTGPATLATTAVHLFLSSFEMCERQDVLAIPFVLDSLLAGLRSSDSTAVAASALSVSSLAGLPGFQALLIQRREQQGAVNLLKLKTPQPTGPAKFTRQGMALTELMISQIGHDLARDSGESNQDSAPNVAFSLYLNALKWQTSLHVAWAAKQLAMNLKVCEAFAGSSGVSSSLVQQIEGCRRSMPGRAFGLIAACTPADQDNDSEDGHSADSPGGFCGEVIEEELWTMAHVTSTLAEIVATSPEAGRAVVLGPGVMEGLVQVLRGGCLLPQQSKGRSSDEDAPGEEGERRQQAVLEMRMCATRLLGALGQCVLETSAAAGSQEKKGSTIGEPSRPKPPDGGTAISASDLIKQSLDERALEVLEGCVQLMNKHEDPNLQAEAIYAVSRLTAASSGIAAAFGAVSGSVECCLEVMLAAGKRGIEPDKVNAVAVAAAAATKTLCIVSRGTQGGIRERLAKQKRLGRACAIMLEECSYVRLRQLFPGLGADAGEGGVQQAGNSSLGGSSSRSRGSISRPSRGSISRRSFQMGASFVGSRSMAMQGSGLASLADSGDFDIDGGGPGDVKDVRIVAAEIIANVAATPGDGSEALLNPKNSIITPLVGLLKMEDVHATTIASSALWALTTTLEGAEAVGSEKRNAMGQLAKVMGNKKHPAAQANAAGCLASLARLETNLERMGTLEGCISGLVPLMQKSAQALEDIAQAPPSIGGWKAGSDKEPNKSVLEDQLVSAVAAIATMSNSGPVAARIASTKGLTQGLAMALRSESQMVQLYAAGAMGNLANHTASLAVVTAARGLVRSVVRLTRQGKSPQVVETAAGAVRNLAACQRGREELAKEASSLQSLVALVSEQDSEGQETQLQAQLKAAAALGNLSADRMGLEALAHNASGYVSSLMKVLRSKKVNAKLAQYTLVALSNGASHPKLAAALMEDPSTIQTFVGNFLACIPMHGQGLGRNGMSSLKLSADNSVDNNSSAMSPASIGHQLDDQSYIAEVCYLEALRQLAGASSVGAGQGSVTIAECGGADLHGALLEVLKIGAATAAYSESSSEDGSEEASDNEEERNTQTRVALDDSSMLPPHHARRVRIDMASAAAGVLAQLLLQSRLGIITGESAKGLEDTCLDALDPLIDLVETSNNHSDSICMQAAIALWTICAAPCVPAGGQAAAAAAQSEACKLLASREDAIEFLFETIDTKTNASADGMVRAIHIFDPLRLFSGALVGHLVAHAQLPDETLSWLLDQPKQLIDLLSGLLYSPTDSSMAGSAATSSKSLREVEVDTHKSADEAFAAALRAGLSEAGMHGASCQLLAADAARTLGHVSGLPQATAALQESSRLMPGLLRLLQGAGAVHTVVLESVLTALAGISAYCPENQGLLASMIEGGGPDGGDSFREHLTDMLTLKQSRSVQAHAATVVGHLATARQSVCEALADDNTITSLVRLLDAAAASTFVSSGSQGLHNDAGFVVASVSGCLMNVSQGGGAVSVARNPVAVRVIAKSMVAAANAAMQDIKDHVALSCAAYGAATLCALLAGSEETYQRVAGDQETLASLAAVLQVPQLDTQKAALLALCSLVPSAQGGKSARKEWGRGGVAASGQQEFQGVDILRKLIDSHKLTSVLGEMTDADDPVIRQNAAWLLSQ